MQCTDSEYYDTATSGCKACPAGKTLTDALKTTEAEACSPIVVGAMCLHVNYCPTWPALHKCLIHTRLSV